MQKCPPAVCGVLVLLKKGLDSLVLEEIGAAEERLLFLRLDQRPVWIQQDPQHIQDLFTRCVCVCVTREESMELVNAFFKLFVLHMVLVCLFVCLL